MEAAAKKMEEQLELWSLQIDQLATKTEAAGARAGSEDVMYVDELKALYAIARSKLDKFRGAAGPERARLKADMKRAWSELDAAFKNPIP